MPGSTASESPVSVSSGLSARYALVSSPCTSARLTSTAEKQRGAAETNEDDIYGASDYNAELPISFSASTTAGSQPPPLQPVRYGSPPRQSASPLSGCTPPHSGRKVASALSSSHHQNTSSNNNNNSSLLVDDNKSTASVCSRHSEADSKSERHRRYSQAVQAPLPDSSSGFSLVRTSRQHSSTSGPVPAAEAQTARTEGRRSTLRSITPATTNITAASARRPSGGRLEPLQLAGSSDGAAIAATGGGRDGQPRTPGELRRPHARPIEPVSSAPTYLSGGPASGRSVIVGASFLREPLHSRDASLEDSTNQPEASGAEREEAASARLRASLLQHSPSSPDTQPSQRRPVLSAEHRQPPPVAGILTNKDARGKETREQASASPAPVAPHSARNGASRSGSGVFSMHTLVSRNKNVDNFDYGLSALGFPVEASKQSRAGSASPGTTTTTRATTGFNNSGLGSFLVATAGHAGLEGGGGSITARATASPSGLLASASSTSHPSLPALTQPHTPGAATTLSHATPHANGAAANFVSPLMPLVRPASGSLRADTAKRPPPRPASGSLRGASPPRIVPTEENAAASANLPANTPSAMGNSPSSTPSAGAAAPAPETKEVTLTSNGMRRPLPSYAAGVTGHRSTLPASLDASQLKSSDAAGGIHVSESRSIQSLEETKAGLGAGYDETPMTASSISNIGTLPGSSTIGGGSSGALGSISLRSIVLQPRRLPRNLEDVYNMPRESSNDFFVLPHRSDASESINSSGNANIHRNSHNFHTQQSGAVSGSQSYLFGASAVRTSHLQQPAPGIETPTRRTPNSLARAGAAAAAAAKVRGGDGAFAVDAEVDAEALRAPAQPRTSDDDGDSLLYGDFDDSCNSDEDDDNNNTTMSSSDDDDSEDAGEGKAVTEMNSRGGAAQRQNDRTAEAGRTGSTSAPAQLLSSKSEDTAAAAATTPSPVWRSNKTVSCESPTASGEREAARRRSSSAQMSSGVSAEERQLSRTSRDTFLPFEESTTVGSRGFGSLLLTSFLRHAGSGETVWTSTSSGVVRSPHAITSNSSSPPSSLAATVTGLHENSLGGGINTATGKAGMPAALGTVKNPLAAAAGGSGNAGSAGATTAAASATSATPPSTQKTQTATNLSEGSRVSSAPRTNAMRVPAPPQLSPRLSGKAVSRLSGVASGIDRAPQQDSTLSPELVQGGVLRWTKPLTPAEVAAGTAEPGGAATTEQLRTSERLLRQLALSNHGAWQDTRGLSILERRGPVASPAARVFAVDDGYTVRVVQHELMGDCETDECVECCTFGQRDAPRKDNNATTSTALAAAAAAAGPPPPTLTLPSVLLDSAVQRFFEEGENAIAMIMDTAADFAATHPSPVKRNNSSSTYAPSGGVRGASNLRSVLSGPDESGDLLRASAVADAVCRKVVRAFLAFKEAKRRTQPNTVADLKVAVALVPVLPSTPPATASPVTHAAPGTQSVFFDVVGKASAQLDCCRPLEIATSPIFGTCLNECQWLVVEDESDIAAAFSFLRSTYAQAQGQQGFLYIQFLHQCFVPGACDGGGIGDGATSAEGTTSRGVAGFARRRNGASQSGNADRNTRLGDIVVSSFTIASSRYPQVFEVLLDQRADTPWPLLRYALGKGPSTVVGVVRVHEEDEEAAYPLSILQRIKALQHPRPRRGSVRNFIAEQRTKMTDLRRRLAEAEEAMARAATTTLASRVTTKRLSVLISKLECSATDAEEFLRDPELAHVPVYVDAHRPLSSVTHADRQPPVAPPTPPSTSSSGTITKREPSPRNVNAAAVSATTPSAFSAASTAAVASGVDCAAAFPLTNDGEPVLLAMVQHYDASTDTVKNVVPASPKSTARWTLSPKESSASGVETRRGSRDQQQQQQQQRSQRTLTAWLTLTKSVSFTVQEVTALGSWRESSPLHPPQPQQQQQQPQQTLCETWCRVRSRFHAGCNATVVMAQEKQEASCLWSLKASVELVHGVLRSTWANASSASTTQRRGSTDSDSGATQHAVVRVAVSVYHVSVNAVADLLRNSTTSRVITGQAAAGNVSFVPATVAIRPLTGTAVPLHVTSQSVQSLPQLEAVLREAVERLRSAQAAVSATGAVEDVTADGLTRRCLAGPGYTVMTVELTQRVTANGERRRRASSSSTGSSKSDGAGNAAAPADGDDVIVSTLSVVNLGGHYGLLRDAITASTTEEEVARSADGLKPSAAPPLPTVAASLLARLAVRRRDLVVCAAALPPYPTAATAYGLLNTLAEFAQEAACAPVLRSTASPGSVRAFLAHLNVCMRGETADVANVRDAVRRAQAVLRDPHKAVFESYPYSPGIEAALELPAARSSVVVDTSSLTQHNASSMLTTAGTVSTIGGSGSSPEVSAMPDGQPDKSWAQPTHLPQHEVPVSSYYSTAAAGGKQAQSTVDANNKEGNGLASMGKAAAGAKFAVPAEDNKKLEGEGVRRRSSIMGATGSTEGCTSSYFGVRYRGHDPVLTQRDILHFVARPSPSTAAALAERTTEEDVSATEAVWMPSVLVLNAATTGAYVKRHGTRVRVPLPASTSSRLATYSANEVVNIKPTSMGMKSSLLMRVVSCVSRGRTAALLIADTESCDATSCIAWLTLRTVMGGIFQALKIKEVEGVQHSATLRAFLVEENRENEFADLLAPRLTEAQPRHLLTRLKHSPFCGPSPADATGRLVKDLQDVNVALSSVLAAARLVHPPTTTEPLRGAIVLQLTFHQYIPATATAPADVVISSLWCVQMGCSAAWMEALHSAPSSSTGSLLQYWMGGPCYTTSIVGLSRFTGVRTATWKELVSAQRRLREVPLRMPRYGSVQAYIAFLHAWLTRAAAAAPKSVAGRPTSAEDKTTTTGTSTSSSATSTPTKVEGVSSGVANSATSSGAARTADSLTRVTALLKEAQRMVERGGDAGKSTQLPGQLAHEAKTFAALD